MSVNIFMIQDTAGASLYISFIHSQLEVMNVCSDHSILIYVMALFGHTPFPSFAEAELEKQSWYSQNDQI
jgi:hypothetical protein